MFKINACIKMVHQTMLMFTNFYIPVTKIGNEGSVYFADCPIWIISFKALNNALMPQRILNLHKGNISTPNCVVEVKSIEIVYF